MDASLIAIRRLMLESNGLGTIVFRRSLIKQGIGKSSSNLGEDEYDLSNKWLTSSYCQIELAMAFQLGILVFFVKRKRSYGGGCIGKRCFRNIHAGN